MNLHRTMLFAPGNNAALVRDAHIYRPDAVMFDLEDAVPLDEKDAARLLVYQTLKAIEIDQTETVVRINGLNTPYGKEDLRAMVRVQPDVIRIPKTETIRDVQAVEEVIAAEERAAGLEVGKIKLMAAIEGPVGVLNAYQIATASPRMIAIALGAEDYTTSLKTSRSKEGLELTFARGMIVNAARAAGIYALDTVFGDVNDEDGFRKEVQLIKQLGFDGKSVITPRQIPIVHAVFTPDAQDIEQAQRILLAVAEAAQKKSGVIALDGKMIDKPIIERAQRTLDLARISGCLCE